MHATGWGSYSSAVSTTVDIRPPLSAGISDKVCLSGGGTYEWRIDRPPDDGCAGTDRYEIDVSWIDDEPDGTIRGKTELFWNYRRTDVPSQNGSYYIGVKSGHALDQWENTYGARDDFSLDSTHPNTCTPSIVLRLFPLWSRAAAGCEQYLP